LPTLTINKPSVLANNAFPEQQYRFHAAHAYRRRAGNVLACSSQSIEHHAMDGGWRIRSSMIAIHRIASIAHINFA
jgi:hypothetical protein